MNVLMQQLPSQSMHSQQIYAHFDRIKVDKPPPSLLVNYKNNFNGQPCQAFSGFGSQKDETALKEWIWETHKERIFASMSIKYENEHSELEMFKKRLDLLDKVAQVQRQYLQSEGPKVVYGHLLDGLLDLMQSEYGFIAELKQEDDGTNYLHLQAATNIAWDEATQKFYDDYESADGGCCGLKFYNFNNLFGEVILTKEYVISNDPRSDKRSKGLPRGHLPIHHFMGIPFFNKQNECIGMVGIANKPGGYSEDDVAFLEPFTVTCSNLIQAYWQIQSNKHLINTLEQKVSERTHKLEVTNKNLEEANKRVLQASAAQLEHFACMSHEIRTPLNCIIGLSSVLQQEGSNNLTAMQKESVEMIVSSGDLLLTVVNDVLDYSKLETGNVDIEIQKSNLQETLNSVVHSIELKAQSKRIVVKTLYGTTVPEYVKTDSRRLQQILYNLLGNAMKFSHEGGVVELSVQVLDEEEEEKSKFKSQDKNVAVSTLFSKCPVAGHSNATASPLFGKCPVAHMNATTLTSALQSSFTSRKKFKSDEYAPPSPTTVAHPALVCPMNRIGSAIHCAIDNAVIANAHKNVIEKESNKSEQAEQVEDPMTRCPLYRPPKKTPSVTATSPVAVDKQEECQKPKRTLRFSVKDYGKGIERKDFDRIFRPFLQANAETERVFGGTGLGLAITAKLVNGLGGSISVDSDGCSWSQFTVDFPFDSVNNNNNHAINSNKRSSCMSGYDKDVDNCSSNVEKDNVASNSNCYNSGVDNEIDRSMVVSLEEMSSILKDASVCLVGHQSECVERARSIFQQYKINFSSSRDLQELMAKSSMNTGMFVSEKVLTKHKHHTIYLVQEDCFDSNVFANMGKPENHILITFGPKYKVCNAAVHYRCLSQLLPSVFVKSMASHVPTSGHVVSVKHKKLVNGASHYRDMQVLVAEDNVINQKVMLRMLNRLGVQNVEIVDNGKKAVEREAVKCFDVVFMDMQMPVMDGVEACKLITQRQGGHHPRALVIFVTAHVSESFEDECRAAGSFGFVQKPCNIRSIEKWLHEVYTNAESSDQVNDEDAFNKTGRIDDTTESIPIQA